jgi:drug/metabolite transporter (DMT)-like permease
MRKLPSVTSAVLANLDPVLNPIWVFLFLGEFPGWLSLVGTVIVLATIMVYQLTQTGQKTPETAQGQNN